MSDEQPFYAPSRKPAPPRQPRPTEHLWAIRKDSHQYDCELLDHGTHGIEVQVLRDLERFDGHRCETHELAIAETDERKVQYLHEGGVLIA
jgi:hypothetical protein